MTAKDLVEIIDRVDALDLRSAFAGKRVIITGSRGFLGQAFVSVFSTLCAEVIAIDRYGLAQEMGAALPVQLPGVEHVDHDVTKPFPVYGRIDYILSLAAIASPVHYARRPLDCFDVIVNGTRNMLELAGVKNATLLLSSTSELYGDPSGGSSEMREHALGALDPWDIRGRAYDVPKLASEALAAIFNANGVKIQTVRYFNVFGTGLTRGDFRVMSKFAAAVVDGTPLQVHGFGDSTTRSFCYLTDAIVGTLLVLAKGDRTPYNVGNPQETSMRDLAFAFDNAGRALFNRTTDVVSVEPPSAYTKQPRRRKPDITRLSGLGFEPRVSLQEGVVRLLHWAQEAYQGAHKS